MYKISLLIFSVGLILFAFSCGKHDKADENITIPTVTTKNVDNITKNSVRAYGNIESIGGVLLIGPARVIASGFVWSTENEPTIEDSKTVNGPAFGSFSQVINGLHPGTKYYLRFYATNAKGTGYGEVISFVTSPDPGGGNDGSSPNNETLREGEFMEDFSGDQLKDVWNTFPGLTTEGGIFTVSENQMSVGGPGHQIVAFQAPQSQMVVNENNGFKLAVTIHIQPFDYHFGGVVFNFQEGGAGFYLLRSARIDDENLVGATLLQILKAGENGVEDWQNDDLLFSDPVTPPGVFIGDYRVEITSKELGKFNVKILDPDTNSPLLEQDFVDHGTPYNGGDAGLYSVNYRLDKGLVSFEDFYLNIKE